MNFNVGDKVILTKTGGQGEVTSITKAGAPRVLFNGAKMSETVSPLRLTKAKIFKPKVTLRQSVEIKKPCHKCGLVGNLKISNFDSGIGYLWCSCGNSTTFYLNDRG